MLGLHLGRVWIPCRRAPGCRSKGSREAALQFPGFPLERQPGVSQQGIQTRPNTMIAPEIQNSERLSGAGTAQHNPPQT